MDRKTIDQTASELQLNRVIYIVKLLRAVLLHVVLAAVAGVLYLVAGIRAYPVGTALFQALWASSIERGPRISQGLFVVTVGVVILAVLALLVWMYRSITNVRRSALRVQATLVLVVALWNLNSSWPELRFAFQHLNQLFAVLAALSVAMTKAIIPFSLAFRLLGVARVQENSSFLATLDPRLAPNFWVYVNKLLDLPRTPLRTAQTAGAYLLAFAGALLMIASMIYLLTVGGASNKLYVLMTFYRHNLLEESIAHSSREAWNIMLLLPCALAGVKLAAFLQSSAKKLGGLTVSDLIRNQDERFLLYLRPFDLDDVILPKPRLPLGSRLFTMRPYPVRIEEELFDVADGYRALIAVGKPGEAKSVRGGTAYRTFLDDSEWQGYVTGRIQHAERVVMVLKNTEGVRWEFQHVVGKGAACKTLFFFHPDAINSEVWERIGTMAVQGLREAGLVPPDFGFANRPLGFFFQAGRLVEIVNANWSATSYRTAFSHFLAESARR